MASNMLFNRTSFAGGALGFNLTELNHLIDGGLPKESELIHYVDNKWDSYFKSKDAKLSKWMTLIDLQIRLPELLLMRMDKLIMQSAVEARVPFLDHKLVEYVLTIPEHIIFDGNNTKPLLKKVAATHIPENIINRKKQGFRVPITQWFSDALGRIAEQKLRDFCKRTDYFRWSAVSKLIYRHDDLVWYLLNFVLWHELWIEGVPGDELIQLR